MKKRQKTYAEKLLELYFRGRYEPDLERKVQRWYGRGSFEAEKDRALKAHWDSLPTLVSRYSYMKLDEQRKLLGFPDRLRIKKMPLRRVVGYAAAVLLPLLVAAGVLLTMRDKTAGTVSVSVTDGIQKIVTLPDSSKVWLNQGARIEYADKLAGGRDVRVSGEAYFDVAGDRLKPFTVRADGFEVRVVGTEFNINAPLDGVTASVELYRGSVEFVSGVMRVVMKPGERLTYDRAMEAISVRRMEPADHYDWRNVKFSLSRASLGEILESIGKYYGYDMDNRVRSLDGEELTLSLSGEEDIHEAMELLGKICERFEYQINNGTVVVRPR